jgi:hypothetical protein
LGVVKYMVLSGQSKISFEMIRKRARAPLGVGLVDADVVSLAVTLEESARAAHENGRFIGMKRGSFYFADRRPESQVIPGKLANSLLLTLALSAQAATSLPRFANESELRKADEELKVLLKRIEAELESRYTPISSASEHNEGN